MNQLIKRIIFITTTTVILSSLNLSVQAQENWSGRGEIVEGNKRGAFVKLKIQVNNNIATIKSALGKEEKIELNRPQFTQTDTGEWRIYRCDLDLCAILRQEQPSRIIYYRLYQN